MTPGIRPAATLRRPSGYVKAASRLVEQTEPPGGSHVGTVSVLLNHAHDGPEVAVDGSDPVTLAVATTLCKTSGCASPLPLVVVHPHTPSRRQRRLVEAALFSLAIAAAACSSEDTGGVIEAPPTSAGGAAARSDPPVVVGRSLRFDVTQMRAPADRPFTMVFENEDGGIQHNLAVYKSGPPAKDRIAATELETGKTSQQLRVDALLAGTYFYQCDVHPTTMTGILTVA